MKPRLEMVALAFAIAFGISAMSSRVVRADHDEPAIDAATWKGRSVEADESYAARKEPAEETAADAPPAIADDEERMPMSAFALARLDEAARSDDWRAIDAASAAAVTSGAVR
jgi:hypothetical protein